MPEKLPSPRSQGRLAPRLRWAGQPMRIHASSIVASVFAFASLVSSSNALADDAPMAPLPAPAAPAAGPTVKPEPGQAAAAAPAPTAIPITATCTLGEHHGVPEAEARTAADVVCHELAKARATNTAHEVRFGTLGGKTLITVASRSGNTYDERRAFLTGLDEVHVAAPRLVSSLVDGKPLDETRSVDNVLTSETRQSKVQRGSMGFDGGFFGTTALGAPAGASGGLDLGLLYRAGNLGVSSHGRAGGIGSAKDKIGLATIDVGVRYYLSSSDFSPFVGGGLGLSYFHLSRSATRTTDSGAYSYTYSSDLSGSGFGAHAVVGAEMLRTHHAAFSVSLRVDAPMFALKGGGDSRYVMPASLNVGILFH